MSLPPNDPALPGTPRQMPRVLITDQSPAVIDRLATLIDDVAQVIGRATNVHDAMRTIGTFHPHLTVLDVAIAHGVDLLRYLRTHHPPVITVVLTHSADDTTRDYCLRLGARHFLDKIREFHKVREIVIAFGNSRKPGACGDETP